MVAHPCQAAHRSTHIQAAVGTLNRLELVGETLRSVLNLLALSVPEWLHTVIAEDWFERYSVRVEEYRLPAADRDRVILAERIGADGYRLLGAIYDDPAAPNWLRQLPAVEFLRQVWLQQFYAESGWVSYWRDVTPVGSTGVKDLPAVGQALHSPYDPDCRFGNKRSVRWVGYKVPLSETCEPDLPHLITHVETTQAPGIDHQALEAVHAALAAKDCLPGEHLVDTGYASAPQLVTSKSQYGIELVAPVREDHSWQAKAGQGFDMAAFAIDWQNQSARCPAGQTSTQWKLGKDVQGHPLIKISFRQRTCSRCNFAPDCTQAKAGRSLNVHLQPEHEALLKARQTQETEGFQRYALRAGIEGTIAQAVQAFQMRRSRYRGVAKTHLQHVLTATAVNLVRIAAWLRGEPLAQTRISRFAALANTT